MNILHYFLGPPPFHSGGLMIYVRDLAIEQFNNGNNIIMLMPGRYSGNNKGSEIKYYKKIKKLPIYQIDDGLPVSTSGIRNPELFMKQVPNNNYKKFLLDKGIDIVHVHSLIGLPKEFILEAKELKIKTFFTTHDYFGICPKVNLFNYKNSQCVDYNNGLECVKCNNFSDDTRAIRTRNRQFNVLYNILKKTDKIKAVNKVYNYIRKKRITIKGEYNKSSLKKTVCQNDETENDNKNSSYVKLREYYMSLIENIDVLLFNSKVTGNEYGNYIDLTTKKYIILHVIHGSIKDNREEKTVSKININKTNFTFMGTLTKHKGFLDLIETLDKIKESYKNWKLSIYGDHLSINIERYDTEYYHFKGPYTHNDLSDIFAKTDILIIPSKWKETFGFIGLEALSYGIPVLCSDNVGFSDLINSGENGIIYKDDKTNIKLYNAIVNILDNPSQIETYKSIILSKDFDFSFNEHVLTLNKIYNEEC